MQVKDAGGRSIFGIARLPNAKDHFNCLVEVVLVAMPVECFPQNEFRLVCAYSEI